MTIVFFALVMFPHHQTRAIPYYKHLVLYNISTEPSVNTNEGADIRYYRECMGS